MISANITIMQGYYFLQLLLVVVFIAENITTTNRDNSHHYNKVTGVATVPTPFIGFVRC